MFFQPLSKRVAIVLPLVFAACVTGVAQQRAARPYVDLSFRGGSRAEMGEGLLFVPLMQNGYEMLFADVRGRVFDGGAEGNWGLAYRRMLDGDRILGVYGFYDLRSTELNNQFQQGSIGAELLNERCGIRINGYLPDNGNGPACHLSRASLAGNRIVVRPGLETAYWGLDAEFERLLHAARDTFDSEIWGAIGAYHFDDRSLGFENISGPRIRLDWRLYHIPPLGPDSRLVIGGQFQYDGVRGAQGTGFVSVRIPFGPGGDGTRPLEPIERRWVNPIARDVDIVTNTGLGSPEPALFPDGSPIGPVTVIDATTPDVAATVAAAGPGSVVVFDGSKGTIDLSVQGGAGAVLEPDQFAGGMFDVIGAVSRCTATFGMRPTVTDPTNTFDVFDVTDGTTVAGINIVGGLNGIFGVDVTGGTFRDNVISGARGAAPEGNGIRLDGTVSATVANNVAFDNEVDGFVIEDLVSGVVSGNTAFGNGEDGFTFDAMNGGTVSGNVSHSNGDDGLDFTVLADGTVSGNTAFNNRGDGLDFDTFSGGTVSGNTATGNDEVGFDTTDFISGLLSGNTATGNVSDGFAFENFDGGTARNNVARDNDDGFNVTLFASGMLDSNVGEDNDDDGFDIDDVTGGSVTGNVARRNDDGFDFDNIDAGSIGGNRSESNDDDGFDFDFVSGGMITTNTAADNDTGFEIEFTVGNTALFEANTALNNTNLGYDITGTPSSTGSGNTGSGNGGNNTFP